MYRLVASPGKTKDFSATNCKHIKETFSTNSCASQPLESGVYWVQVMLVCWYSLYKYFRYLNFNSYFAQRYVTNLPRRNHLARRQMQDLSIKRTFSCRILQNSCRILQDLTHFPARISLAIKKDLFWHNLAGSCRITLSG